MQYGYFDDAHREYVVQRPDTPAPWVNYLGSPEYGAIISNNAGGYSFAKSGANGRILRYVFNQFDRPGRYLYLRDNASGDFWSASWQPVGKDLQDYACECRHGMGYTRMLSDYAGIHAEAVYYVPKDSAHEVWELTVTNTTDAPRELTLTGYAEFTNHNNYEQDQVNLQSSSSAGRCLRATASPSRSTATWTPSPPTNWWTARTSPSGSSGWRGRTWPATAATRKPSWAGTMTTATPRGSFPATWATC